MVAFIVSFVGISIPMRAQALVAEAVVVTADVSLPSISRTIDTQMQRLKSFVLDRLATLIAKQILHQLTVSVVNWINTGFKGSPAFLTNPEGFFLDVADQITGAFLATNGPLSTLCSPFSIDIRLSLALSQTNLIDQRYTCTLSKIISAQKNGPDVTINGKVVHSSSGSINGFMNGDFNQGGWPAFLALTTVPQNNPYGAMLYAKADLSAKIANQQNKIKADLQLGSGFMSWESCKDIPGYSNVDVYDPGVIDEMESSGAKTVANKDGSYTFQQCETQTPGSVIAGTLQTNLDVPVVELELANDINAIVNALVTQMVSQMLSSGLHALSGSSGSGQSFTQQIINDSRSSAAAQSSVNNLQASVTQAMDQVSTYQTAYDQAVSLMRDSKNRLTASRACFADKLSTYAGRNSEVVTGPISHIDDYIATNLDPVLKDLAFKQASAIDDWNKLKDISISISATGSAEQVQAQAENYSNFVQAGGLNMDVKVSAAEAALSTAQTMAQEFNNEAANLMTQCQKLQ